MPTYQYACTACGHQLEMVQSFTDDPLTQCPACEGRLRKLFGSVGVVFKGPGFYRTDSRAGTNGNRETSKETSKDSGKDASKEQGTGSGKKADTSSTGDATSKSADTKKDKAPIGATT